MKSRNWIVCADYAQLELRIQALVSGDKPLLKVFAKGDDAHASNAADLFGVTIEDVTKAQRQMAKMGVYQMNYGGDPIALWKKLVIDFPDVTVMQCHRFHEQWFIKHFRIKQYHKELVAGVRKHGFLEAPVSGHRLFFYGKIDPTKIFNYPIQHTAADIINPTISEIDKKLKWPKEGILAQVHDEIVVDGPDPLRLARILKKCMTRTITLNGHSMTFPVDVSLGRDWGNCVELNASKPMEPQIKALIGKSKKRSPGEKKRPTRKGASAASAKHTGT